MQLMCILVTIGTVIQTASVNMGMFLAGRIIAGIAVGGMVGTVPTYLSEISPPESRGLIGGISGAGLSCGVMISNWVGFACSYAPYGALQWRLPLGIQIPWGVIMFAGLCTFMPDSPRQLIRSGKIDAARRAFIRITRHEEGQDLEPDFLLIKAQIEAEKEREVGSYREIIRLFRHRVLVSVGVQTMTSLTGVNVIQYFQTRLYKSLGIEPKLVLALAAIYGTCGFISNCFAIRYLLDRWGRRNMMLSGLACCIVIEIYSAIMQRQFQDTDNKIGKAFAILGIYLFVVTYYAFINSTTWIYGAEVLPVALRSKVMGIASASHFIFNVAVTEAGPSALSTIKENYYYVFVGCTVVFIILGYFYFVETRHKTLEEIAVAFGDRAVLEGETRVTMVAAVPEKEEEKWVENESA